MSNFDNVIFIETSVLLDSCIRTGGKDDKSDFKVESDRYPSSIGLIRKASSKNNCCTITSKTVEDEATDKLEKAIMNAIKDREDIDEISVILDDCERKLNDNLKLIDRLAVDEEIKKKRVQEVMQIYISINSKYDSSNYTIAWSYSPRFKGIAKDITQKQKEDFDKIKERIEEKKGVGGLTDAEIVADAISLQEKRFPNSTLYLASNDKDIAGGDVEPWSEVRREFTNKFPILPLTPEEILGEI